MNIRIFLKSAVGWCTTKADDLGAVWAQHVRIVAKAEKAASVRGGKGVVPSGWWWRRTALNFAGRGRVRVIAAGCAIFCVGIFFFFGISGHNLCGFAGMPGGIIFIRVQVISIGNVESICGMKGFAKPVNKGRLHKLPVVAVGRQAATVTVVV